MQYNQRQENSMRLFSKINRIILALAAIAGLHAQQVSVFRLIRFNGSYHAANQQNQPPVLGATFSIYHHEFDGTPLWSEIQNIRPDKDGNYTALLGSTRADGMPLDLFTATEARWLEVEIDQLKQPRILLGSVPYALKAGDADTLGGLPASAYLRASAPAAGPSNPASPLRLAAAVAPFANSGMQGYIPMFANTTDLVNSIIYQSGTNAISVGGTASLGAMTLIGNVPSGDAPGLALFNQGGGLGASTSIDFYSGPAANSSPRARFKAIDDGDSSGHLTFWTKNPGSQDNAVTERIRIVSNGDVGIGTSTPMAKLEVNGNVMVDGNLNLTGTIQSGSGGTPVFSAPADKSLNFSAGLGALQSIAPNGFDGTNNTAVGTNALHAETAGTDNTAVGVAALSSLTTACCNTAVGSGALRMNTDGMDNVAIGPGALGANISGSSNVGIGEGALNLNTTGDGNVAIGEIALLSNTSGSSNIALGNQALGDNTTGNSNIAVGEIALSSNTTGNNNVAVGFYTLFQNTTGLANTAVGEAALGSTTTGSGNIALGSQAGSSVTTGSNNIYIGNSGSAADNGATYIGTDGKQTSAFIAGISGVNVSGVPVLVSGSGQLGIAASSRRFKQDIREMGDATDGLMRLRPVTYRYKQPFDDGSRPLQYGLIAEEVAEVYPDLVARSADGQIQTVKYLLLDSMLLNEVQKQRAAITAQQEKIQWLENRLAHLESILTAKLSPESGH
jgi:hypothetical protein